MSLILSDIVPHAPHQGHGSGIRQERRLASKQFAEGAFRNTHGAKPGLQPGTGMPVLRDYLLHRGRRIPTAPLPALNPLEAWSRPPQSGLRATWLGHSTVWLEIDGMHLLTDPVWGPRASPTRFAGPKRFQPVPVAFAQLPHIDAILLSHDHFDHLDHTTVAALRRLETPIITSRGVGRHLEAWGIAPQRIHELDWWESLTLRRAAKASRGLTGSKASAAEVRITAAPSQHFSGRGLFDRNHTLWSALVVTGPKHKVFFSGDTGLTPEYRTIAERLGPFDLILLEVGAYHPAWGQIHLGPDQAVIAHQWLGGGLLLPVHWGTFNLAMHDWDEPAERLYSYATQAGLHTQHVAQSVAPGGSPLPLELAIPRLGEVFEPQNRPHLKPWWRDVDAPLQTSG